MERELAATSGDQIHAGSSPASVTFPRIGLHTWLLLAVLLLMTVLSYVDRSVISLLVDPIRKDLGLGDVQMSLLLGMAFGLCYALFSVPLGWLVDRRSRRAIIFWGVAGWSVATMACGLTQTFGQLFVARFAVGIGEASLAPAAYAMLTDSFPRHRLSLAIGILGAGAGVGGTIAYMLGGTMIGWASARHGVSLPVLGHLAPWQFAFVAVGLPGLFLAPLIFLVGSSVSRGVPADDDAKADSAKTVSFVSFLRAKWRYLICHFLGFGCIALLGYASGAWGATFFSRRYGMDMATIGLTLGSLQIFSSVAGFVGGGWLADRWFATGVPDAHLRIYVLSCPVMAVVGLLTFAFAPTPLLAIAGYSVLQLLMPFTGPAAAHLQLGTPRALRGRTSALFLLTFNLIGMVCGPTTVALITTYGLKDPMRVGDGLGLTFLLFGLLASLLLFLGLAPAREAVKDVQD